MSLNLVLFWIFLVLAVACLMLAVVNFYRRDRLPISVGPEYWVASIGRLVLFMLVSFILVAIALFCLLC